MARRFSEKQRAAVLAKFERWEGSAAAFCRKFRLSYQTLRGWQRSAARKPHTRETRETPGFVEVELRPRPAAPIEVRGREAVAELDLGSGVVLRVYALREGQS